MPNHDIVVVGGSAGGVEAVREIAAALPSSLPAAVFVVIHMSEDFPSVLANILNRNSKLPVVEARDGEQIKRGHIYVACPGKHMLVDREKVRVVYGPRENSVRPAIDVMFRSASIAYGPRVVAVVVSGTLDDGTAGMYAVKLRGGIGIVQDPQDALFPGMPSSVIDNVQVDHLVPLNEIAPLVARLVQEPAPSADTFAIPHQMAVETGIAMKGVSTLEDVTKIGTVTSLTCPECHGALWEVSEGKLTRFRCQTGHAFSIDTLHTQQSVEVEAALWAALRALEEKAQLNRRISERNRMNNFETVAQKYDEIAQATEAHAAALRKILSTNGNVATNPPS